MMLGNLSIAQMESRLGIKFPEPFRSSFEQKHQPIANGVKEGEWHCFDLPFFLLCGDVSLAKEVFNSLLPLQSQMTGKIEIGV